MGCAVPRSIKPFTCKNREFRFCPDFNSERANRREDIKSGANLPSDRYQKVEFLRNLTGCVVFFQGRFSAQDVDLLFGVGPLDRFTEVSSFTQD